MFWNVIYALVVINAVSSLPHDIQLQARKDFSTPEEVNSLQNSGTIERSISDHVSSQNPEDTVREVEELIRSNPALPRLTRGEILDILDNITKQDQLTLINTINKDSQRDPKALMVVKAYTPLGSGEVNVEEFYTKPPITSIVDNDNNDPTSEHIVSTTSVPYFRWKTTKSSEKKITNVERKKPYRGNIQFKTTTLNTSPRTRSTTERLTTTTNLPSTIRKELKRRRRPSLTTTTMMAITTYRPRSRQPPRKEIKYPNHKYPEDQTTGPTYSANGIRVIEPPKIAPAQLNYDLEDLLPQEGENQEIFMPVNQTKKDNSNSKDNLFSEPSIELEIPEHLKKVVADLNLAAMKDPESVSVTSIVAPSEKDESEKIKDILASLGVLPPGTTSTEVPNANVVADSLSPDMQELLKSFGLLPDADVSNGNQNINEVSDYNPEKAEIHPESYVGFKPLPEDNEGRKEMEDLLLQFGLLDKNKRNGKSLKKVGATSENEIDKEIKIEQISIEAVPDDLKPILQEMGFDGARAGRKTREQPTLNNIADKEHKNNEEPSKASEKQHIFNPVDPKPVSDEDVNKLGRLLEIMKKLEKLNGTITEEELKQIDQKELNDLINSLNPPPDKSTVPLDERNAPNPIEYDFGLNKNEVKRQETTTAEPVETVAAETAETKTPSIKDLEDSFGGSMDAVTEALPESTTARRTGFYYLLDWNTFLDIDDQKGKRVNLRFQPKVGDPKQFYSVTVP